jgi:hypothetical protein
MHNLFNPVDVSEMQQRIENLPPDRNPEWGKMDASRMLAHCSVGLEMAMGRIRIPRAFIGRILGPLFKAQFVGETPFSKNSPTAKEFIMSSDKDFATERAKLLSLLKEFSGGGEAVVTREPHPFFGPLTPAEWSVGMYKHIDHHLRQFAQ